MNENTSAAIKDYLVDLQERTVRALETFDGQRFRSDSWDRAEGGGGMTRILEGGNFFERGGVGFSHVMGATLPPSATANRPELAGRSWEAMGVSLVLHPQNPYCPTVHMNVRFFIAYPVAEGEAGNDFSSQFVASPLNRAHQRIPQARNPRSRTDPNQAVWWFGGGMDLTPYYPFEEDARHFHMACRNALTPYGHDLYPRFKAWCDRYFFLKHRNETRGIGGIFFDDFNELGFNRSLAMTQSVGDAFMDAYLPIVERRRNLPFGDRERDFQAYRRGRYVEFNLVWDRGTLFGLQSGGRTESILMSLPPVANWRYDWRPEPGSEEDRLGTDFLIPRDWLGTGSA